MNKEQPIRELFIEELEEVSGGAPDTSADASIDTTLMCCEELIWDPDQCCVL